MLFPDSFGVERRETTVTKAGDAVVFRVTLSVIAPPDLQRPLDWAIPFDTESWTKGRDLSSHDQRIPL
jgi:hypothetical protein